MDNKPPTTTTHVSLRGVFQAFPTPLSFSFSSAYSLFIISGTVTESLSLYLVFSLFLGGNFSCYACTYVRIAYADDPRKRGFARVFFACLTREIVGGGWFVSTTRRLLRDDDDGEDDGFRGDDELTQTNHSEHGLSSTGNSSDRWLRLWWNTPVSPNSGSS